VFNDKKTETHGLELL